MKEEEYEQCYGGKTTEELSDSMKGIIPLSIAGFVNGLCGEAGAEMALKFLQRRGNLISALILYEKENPLSDVLFRGAHKEYYTKYFPIDQQDLDDRLFKVKAIK